MVFGQKFKQVLGEGGSNKAGNVKVFATEKLTEQNIRAYAENLTGGVPFTEIPNKPGRYYVKLANGSTVNLRKVSTSVDRTKAHWTIEIIGDEQIGKLQDKVKKPVKIKFQ
ncbi:hemagglutinin [Photorhabdus viridis]|uniref:hemagglutinin n=1 Tax=Photorhabdus viridis TaxID=3163327 RepID=UPI003307198F